MAPDADQGYVPPLATFPPLLDDDDDNILVGKFEETNPPKQQQSVNSVYGKNIILAILTHAFWSLLPVASRYLLVKAPSKMSSLVLLSSTKFIAFILTILFGDYHFVFKVPEDDNNIMKIDAPSDLEDQVEKTENKLEDQGNQNKTEEATIQSKIIMGTIFALLTTCRAALGVECLKYTTAKNTSLIQALSPIIVPIADAVFLKTTLPRSLWPTVIISVLGCGIVIFSQKSYHHTFTESDTIGCLMKFASVCITAITRLIMKTSSDILSRNELIQMANVGSIAIPLVISICLDPTMWLYFAEMPSLPVAVLISWCTIGILVYFIGAIMQIELIRALSPGLYSSFEAVRVLGAVLLSSAFLHEPVQNWIEWVGILLTVGVISRYLVLLLNKDKKVRKKVEQGEDITRSEMEEYGCYIRMIM